MPVIITIAFYTTTGDVRGVAIRTVSLVYLYRCHCFHIILVVAIVVVR